MGVRSGDMIYASDMGMILITSAFNPRLFLNAHAETLSPQKECFLPRSSIFLSRSAFCLPRDFLPGTYVLLQEHTGAITFLLIFLVQCVQDMEHDVRADLVAPVQRAVRIVGAELHRRVDIAGAGDIDT